MFRYPGRWPGHARPARRHGGHPARGPRRGFFEHGSLGHALWPLVRGHAGASRAVGTGSDRQEITVDTTVSHVDVAPTMLDLMGLPPDPRMQGQSLLPMALRQGPWTPRVVPSEYAAVILCAPPICATSWTIPARKCSTTQLPTDGKDDVKDQRPMACATCATAPASTWPMYPLARVHLGHAQQSRRRSS